MTKPNLGEGSIPSLLFKLAIPTIVAQMVNLLYNMVDRIYIGHIPGDGNLALTGLGLCFPVIMLVTAFAMLVSAGGAPRAAINLGKGDKEAAEKILGNATAALAILAVILMVVIEAFMPQLLVLFGASATTMPYALGYLRIYCVGTISVMFALGLNTFITCQGFTTKSMTTVLIGAVLNIILDPIFIFVFHWGVMGAAIATIISQTVSAIWVVYFLASKKSTIRIRKEFLRIEWPVLAPMLALGVSPFIMTSTESLLNIAFNASLAKYGGDIAVGSMTILVSVMQLQQMPLQGLLQGGQPIMSFNYGAGKIDRVRQTYRILFGIVEAWSLIFWIIIELNPQIFVRIFANEPAELIAAASWALRIYMAAFGIFNLQLVCQQTFVGLGQAKVSLLIACLRKIILLIPLIFILPHFFADKTFAVFLAEPVADLVSVVVATFLFVTKIKGILAQSPGLVENKE